MSTAPAVIDRPLSLSETAEYLNLSKSYLYKLTSRRMIPHFKPLGKLVYFQKTDLDAFLLQNRIKPAAEIDQQAADRLALKGGRK